MVECRRVLPEVLDTRSSGEYDLHAWHSGGEAQHPCGRLAVIRGVRRSRRRGHDVIGDDIEAAQRAQRIARVAVRVDLGLGAHASLRPMGGLDRREIVAGHPELRNHPRAPGILEDAADLIVVDDARRREMEEKDLDPLTTESTKASVDGATQLFGLERKGLPTKLPGLLQRLIGDAERARQVDRRQTGLRRNDPAIRIGCRELADPPLGCSETISVGGVDEVDPAVPGGAEECLGVTLGTT